MTDENRPISTRHGAPVHLSPPEYGRSHSRSASKLNALSLCSTFILAIGALIAWVLVKIATDPLTVFETASYTFGAALVLAILVEALGGLRNLIRTDIFIFLALYLLTLLEFLFPQDQIQSIGVDHARSAVAAVLVSFVGLTFGRHAFPLRSPQKDFATLSISPRTTISLMIGCLFLGHLYMLIAVNFDVFEMVRQMQRPRFSQPWTRGRYGSLYTLLNEIGLLTYLLPPLAGAVLAQVKRYSQLQITFSIAVLGFVLFEGFASGTRNVFLIYVATFAVAYTVLVPKLTFGKALLIGIPALLLTAFATQALLETRTVGLEGLDEIVDERSQGSVFVDMNIVNIAKITAVVPEAIDFLGWEVPWITLIRPIPRALWPGKPEGLSYSVNDAVGVGDYMTISASFPGELWLAGGYLAIVIGAVLVGAGAGYWNKFGARASSNLELIAYAMGFFPACLMMRSLMSSAPAFLPLIALLVYLKWFAPKNSQHAKNSQN